MSAALLDFVGRDNITRSFKSQPVVKEPILQNKGQMNAILNKIGLYQKRDQEKTTFTIALKIAEITQ